jgi:hypothetical protein
MANKIAVGRADEVAFSAPGLLEFLRDASQALPEFNNEMRKAAEQVAQHVVDRAVVNANGQAPQGKPREGSSGHSQASQVARALRARRDRIPTIKLDSKRGFVSASRPNRSRKQKVTMGNVFFGAEFGGRRKTDHATVSTASWPSGILLLAGCPGQQIVRCQRVFGRN